jgi:ABC-type cobalt transport system substrate-binding protein
MTQAPNSKRRAAIEAVLLFAVLALLIVHTAYWRASGRQADLFEQKDAFAVLYNLGLVLVTGTLVALLMTRVTRLLGYEVTEIEHFAGADESAENPGDV